MSERKEDGGFAFPQTETRNGNPFGHEYDGGGLTIRDYFAAKALTALIAKIPLHDRKGEHGIHTPEVDGIHQVRLDVAESAYDYADAMLKARRQ